MDPPMEASTTHRGLGVVAALFAGMVVVLSLLVVLGRNDWLSGAADCAVGHGDRSVELSTQEAQNAATVAAAAVRERVPEGRAERGVAEVLDASDQDVHLVTSALTGRSPHALTCDHGGADDTESDRLDRTGLTHRAAVVRRDVEAAFGRQREGGFAPGGVHSGHTAGSAHYEGRALDLFFRPASRHSRERGWAMAQYLVAHAERLEIETVIFDARIWTARRAAQGWRDYAPDTVGRSARVAAILEHRDHVHVDVAD